ncbi:MAG: WGR domain-containing protein [Pyrinomonadaceae bacterium]
MRLICQTKLHYKEGNSDKVYEVDLCEAGRNYVVNFRYGRAGTDLREGSKTTTPVSLAEAEKIFQNLVDEKKRKGYHIVGEKKKTEEKSVPVPLSADDEKRNAAVLETLKDEKAKSNPRIERFIWRAGELKMAEATPHLVKLIGTAKELRDYCIAWSLGFCGDGTIFAELERLTAHPAEHVARIAREAVFKLADQNERNELKKRAVKKLPEVLQIPAENGTAENFETVLRREIEKQTDGSFAIFTLLYEIDNEITRPVLLKILREIPFRPRYFKPVRQIFKMAEYRRDALVFGTLAKRFEIEKAGFYSSPWWDSVTLFDETKKRWEYGINRKKELAGENSRIAYSDKTKDYFRRRTWRTLRRLGEIGDPDYVSMAVGSLLAFSDADDRGEKISKFYDYRDENGNWDWRNPRVTEIHWDGFSPYLLFNHILYENSPRYENRTGARGFRLKAGIKSGDKTNRREEAFPKLWEENPVGLLHLLSESECAPVHEFAVKALRDCPRFTDTLQTDAVLMLLSRPYEITAQFGFDLAAALYDPADPDVELAVAVAICNNEKARQEAFRWMDARRELFAKTESVLLKLLCSAHFDTRKFGAKILSATVYSETEAKRLIELLIDQLKELDEETRFVVRDLGDALIRAFGRNLRHLDLETIKNLLAHPLVEVQEFAGNVLLGHEISAENLPDDLINSLIDSGFEEIRNIGVRLFGQLPDKNLLQRESVFAALLSHELADIYNSTRPIVLRLAGDYPEFAENLSRSIFDSLIREEKAEGVRSRLIGVLREISGWTKFADFETAKSLIDSVYPEANEAGGLIIRERVDDWCEEFTVAEIIGFSSHEILSIRQTSWSLAEKTVESRRLEVSFLVRALDSKWPDSREFWRSFFRRNFTSDELTPEILVAICDSVRKETQKFGRDLLLEYFEQENGLEYLLKLSEHPSAAMQLFATNYLENHASDAPEKLEKLIPYFLSVLSLVNRSRTAKDRVLRFLENEALKNEASARIVARILARQSATLAIGDKAKMIESMLKIGRNFPGIELPVRIKETEVRGHAV